ncbi:MAG: pentapeptide repeat-containing protein [Agarilytica sp.]
MSDEQKSTQRQDIFKYLGLTATFIGIVIPLIAGYFEYRQSVQQELDNSFRKIIIDLTSEDNESRIAAATSMGTFVEIDNKYYYQAIDILVNRISTELDYNVVHSINASLEKAADKDYKMIVKKLLNVERMFFIQEYPLKQRIKLADQKISDIESLITVIDDQSQNANIIANSNQVLAEEFRKRYKDYYNEVDTLDQLTFKKQVAADLLSMFLMKSKSISIKGVEFFRNSMNGAVLTNINFSGVRFIRSAISMSNLQDTNFKGTDFKHTVLTYSDLSGASFRNSNAEQTLFDGTVLKNADFHGSKFNEVFFLGADLNNTDFTNVRGLKPIYFYRAENFSKAKFSEQFLAQYNEQRDDFNDDYFTDYINNHSSLLNSRKDDLLKTLSEINMRELNAQL